MDDQTNLLAEMMLHAEVYCGEIENLAKNLVTTSNSDELRLKISQCQGALSQLQSYYDENSLSIHDPRVAASFRSLVMSLLWVTFRAGSLVDYKLFRKIVQIESGFTYLLISRNTVN